MEATFKVRRSCVRKSAGFDSDVSGSGKVNIDLYFRRSNFGISGSGKIEAAVCRAGESINKWFGQSTRRELCYQQCLCSHIRIG